MSVARLWFRLLLLCRADVSGMTSLLLQPWSEAPVFAPFRRRRTVAAVFVTSWLGLTALVVVQTLTQGKSKQYASVLLSSWSDANDTLSISPAVLSVGSTVYTEPSGAFPWTVVSASIGSSTVAAISYIGADPLLGCTAMAGSLTYSWSDQSFAYSVCANCSVGDGPVSRGRNISAATVRVCTAVDLERTPLPTWTLSTQAKLQAKIFSIAGMLQSLSLPDGSLPRTALPPYGEANAPSAADASIVRAHAIRRALTRADASVGHLSQSLLRRRRDLQLIRCHVPLRRPALRPARPSHERRDAQRRCLARCALSSRDSPLTM